MRCLVTFRQDFAYTSYLPTGKMDGTTTGSIELNPTKTELASVLTRLGISFDLSTFSKRLVLQKKIYLTQLCGHDLGYRFGWYLRGPYSKSLTAEAFELVEEVQSGAAEFDEPHFDEAKASVFDTANRVWEKPVGIDVANDDWLELLASMHYLRHIAYRPSQATRDFESTFTALCDSKPQFADKQLQAKAAWDRLNEFGLIETRNLVPQA